MTSLTVSKKLDSSKSVEGVALPTLVHNCGDPLEEEDCFCIGLPRWDSLEYKRDPAVEGASLRSRAATAVYGVENGETAGRALFKD